LFCFIVGYCVASLMMGVLVAAVKAIFVAFAMDPAALSATHPQYLQKLVTAWQTAHPAAFQQCGYSAAYCGPAGVYAAPPPFYPGQGGGYPTSPAGATAPLAGQAMPVAYGSPAAAGQMYHGANYAAPAPYGIQGPQVGHAYVGAPMPMGMTTAPPMMGPNGYQTAPGYQAQYHAYGMPPAQYHTQGMPPSAGPSAGYPPSPY
jgi:hypothetical protein